MLIGIEGKFVLSINDTPEVRELFSGFNMEEVSLHYSVAKDEAAKSKVRRELIVTTAA